jgi:hypothetical protein
MPSIVCPFFVTWPLLIPDPTTPMSRQHPLESSRTLKCVFSLGHSLAVPSLVTVSGRAFCLSRALLSLSTVQGCSRWSDDDGGI